MALHAQIYAAANRFDAETRCVIHTHSTHCVALTSSSIGDELLPPVTPYFVMKVGHVPLIPYHRPGAPEVAALVAEAIRRYGEAGTPIRAVDARAPRARPYGTTRRRQRWRCWKSWRRRRASWCLGGAPVPRPDRRADRRAAPRVRRALVTHACGNAIVSRTALVTGGGRGIGQGIAIALARAGFDIAILSRETAAEAHTVIEGVRSLGRRPLYVQHDISQIADLPTLIEHIHEELGAVDCLVNNAGVTSLRRGDLLDVAADSFDRSVAVNLRGTFFLTQAVARHMIATPVHERESRYRAIVTITSANAEIVGVDRADYCMTKAALAMMSKLFAARLASEHIHVFELRPGIIRTDMTLPAAEKYDRLIDAGEVPFARWGTPDDVGATVATLAEGRLPFSTGEVINVGGGLHLHRL